MGVRMSRLEREERRGGKEEMEKIGGWWGGEMVRKDPQGRVRKSGTHEVNVHIVILLAGDHHGMHLAGV